LIHVDILAHIHSWERRARRRQRGISNVVEALAMRMPYMIPYKHEEDEPLP
jgi:hypothetical protein